MTWMIVAAALLLVVALSAHALSKRAGSSSGLPEGEVVYSDTGYAVGKLAPAGRDREGRKQERPLASRRYGLIGRPDYLVKTRKGIIPVEAKSARMPAGGRPHDSHVFQLAAYCLLVEDCLGAPVPYGIIRYRDSEVEVEYTPELRAELIELLGEMREVRELEEVHRDHEDARRCGGCVMRASCDEAL